MTPEQLIEKCNKQIEIMGIDGAEVLLMIPGRWGKCDTRKLVKGDKSSPVGMIVEDNMDGRGLRIMFKARDVKVYVEEMLMMVDDERV